MVGNSSSGLIEAPQAFGLPVVNVGTRQEGRLRARNVINVGDDRSSIVEGLRRALDPTFREGLAGLRSPFGDGRAAPPGRGPPGRGAARRAASSEGLRQPPAPDAWRRWRHGHSEGAHGAARPADPARPQQAQPRDPHPWRRSGARSSRWRPSARVELHELVRPDFNAFVLRFPQHVILTYPFTCVGFSRWFYVFKLLLRCRVVCLRAEGVVDLSSQRSIDWATGYDTYRAGAGRRGALLGSQGRGGHRGQPRQAGEALRPRARALGGVSPARVGHPTPA